MQQTKQRSGSGWKRLGGVVVATWMVATWMVAVGCTGAVSWSGIRASGGGPNGAPSGESIRGTSGESSGGQGGGGRQLRTAVMPELTLMTQAEAEAALRRAGFEVAPELDAFACGSTLGDHRVVELGRVCAQVPVAGKQASTSIPVKLRVQAEDPWRGEFRPGHSWFLMLDLSGMDAATATSKLRQLGYTGPDVQLLYVEDAGCQAGRVCRTFPEAWSRAESTSPKVLYLGKPR